MNFFSFRKKQPDIQEPAYLITGDLNITLVLDGQTHTIGTSHPNHQIILEAIKNKDWAMLPDLVDMPQSLSAKTEGLVSVNEFGEVFYAGEPMHNAITARISQFFQQGLDFQPLMKFLQNLMNNPSKRAVEELYTFLENEGMPITEDGCFVGYKAVRDDYTDLYSGQFDNHPGQVLEMARNLVDDDARRACSNGFHVGSQAYASSFGGRYDRIMLVKVNPADAVSVPYDGGEKLRTCRYEVLREVDRSTLLQEPVYTEESFNDEYDPLDDDDPFFS